MIVNDDFTTVVTAIRHGRAIYSNIQKFVLFLIGTNSVQVVVIVAAVSAGIVIPFTPLSILFVNLATDGLASVAISVERGEEDLMTMPPRRAGQAIITGRRVIMLFGHIIALAIALTINFLLGLYFFTGHFLIKDYHYDVEGAPDGDSTVFNNCREYVRLTEWRTLTDEQCVDGIARARTMAFLLICLTECLRGYTVRNFLRPMWVGLFTNPTMVIGSLVSTGLMLLFILTPGAREIFGLTNSLPWFGWLIAIGGALFVTVVDEYVKAVMRRREQERKRWQIMQEHFTLMRDELRAVNHKLTEIEREVHTTAQQTKPQQQLSQTGKATTTKSVFR